MGFGFREVVESLIVCKIGMKVEKESCAGCTDYQAPEVEVVEVAVESGFAGSGQEDQLPGWKPTYW